MLLNDAGIHICMYVSAHLGFFLCNKKEDKGSKEEAVAKHYLRANSKPNIVPSCSIHLCRDVVYVL